MVVKSTVRARLRHQLRMNEVVHHLLSDEVQCLEGVLSSYVRSQHLGTFLTPVIGGTKTTENLRAVVDFCGLSEAPIGTFSFRTTKASFERPAMHSAGWSGEVCRFNNRLFAIPLPRLSN